MKAVCILLRLLLSLTLSALVLWAAHGRWEHWTGPADQDLDQAGVPRLLGRYYEMPIVLLGNKNESITADPTKLLAVGSLVYVEEKWQGTYRLRPVGEVAGRVQRQWQEREVECVQLAIQPDHAGRLFGDPLRITYCQPINAFETLLTILVSKARQEQLTADLWALWQLKGEEVTEHAKALFGAVDKATQARLAVKHPGGGLIAVSIKDAIKGYFDAAYTPVDAVKMNALGEYIEEFWNQLTSERFRPLLRETLDKLWTTVASVPHEGQDVGLEGLARRYLLVDDPQEGTMFTPEVVLILRRLIFRTHVPREQPWRPADSWVVIRPCCKAEPQPQRVRPAYPMSNPGGWPAVGAKP